jgi:hypothetical protein
MATKPTNRSIPLWEYLTVQVSDDGQFWSLPAEKWLDLIELGDKGWELVAVAPYTIGDLGSDFFGVAFFKRPLP